MLAAFCLGTVTLAAQTAREVLDNASAKLRAAGGMQATFEATTFQGTTQTGGTSGSIFVQGAKFQVSSSEMSVWFDGKTQWSLLKSSDEVNVSTPSAEEVQQMNPYAFVNLYKKGYTLSLTEVTYKGAPAYEARMVAQSKSAPIQEMRVTLGKKSYLPQSIRIRQGSNGWTRIRISALKTGRRWDDKFFRFNPKDYPQAEVIDLR